MGWILCIILVGVVGYFMINDIFDGIGGWFINFIFSIIFGSFLFWGISAVLSFSVETKYTLEYETKVLSLDDKNFINGNFYLDSANVKGEITYIYATSESDGVKISSVSARYAYLNEGNYAPKLDVYKNQFNSPILRYLFADVQDHKYKFFVPKNTIKYGYDVNLSN